MNDNRSLAPLARNERIYLATRIHGLYTLGMAVTESEKTDEDCCMDNTGVPHYYSQLNERDRACLDAFRANTGKFSEMAAAAKAKMEERHQS